MATTVYMHELRIIEMLFAKEGVRVIKQQELIHFLEDRIDIVLQRLGVEPMFNRGGGEISSWFYQQLSSVKIPDFFAATQLQYTRNWAKHLLVFKDKSHV